MSHKTFYIMRGLTCRGILGAYSHSLSARTRDINVQNKHSMNNVSALFYHNGC
jgi:hypothetical protein